MLLTVEDESLYSAPQEDDIPVNVLTLVGTSWPSGTVHGGMCKMKNTSCSYLDRTSKVGWYQGFKHPTVAALVKRIAGPKHTICSWV